MEFPKINTKYDVGDKIKYTYSRFVNEDGDTMREEITEELVVIAIYYASTRIRPNPTVIYECQLFDSYDKTPRIIPEDQIY